MGYVNFNGGNLKVGDGTFSGSATSLGYFASTLASVDVASGVDYTIDAVNSTGSFVKDGAGTLNLKRESQILWSSIKSPFMTERSKLQVIF
ncbi:hypothetical protein HED50_22625 [Ochrobactrum oryzae]|nr:hypothetical protein [Brucella oryzae]